MPNVNELGEAVISTIEQYAPNIRRAIVGMQVITPKDIENIAGITGGNIFHGELLLHQIFFLRPAPQWADFRTPLKGYYFGASRRASRRWRDGRGRDAGCKRDVEGWVVGKMKRDLRRDKENEYSS